ncbi:expressed unknown protein [Ectocarpus siliculosus]|uniref:Uncharacterized protein n=1 Tax=Ectocarpus siliculosus TaxID=2880 RepID=D7G8F6_ECTSI|nr:expressed unknown protein [Ectocarpus siliculosus]|eukprot:CBJ28001.1 expressed unknown protein [Ectocarpus siliculosus]
MSPGRSGENQPFGATREIDVTQTQNVKSADTHICQIRRRRDRRHGEKYHHGRQHHQKAAEEHTHLRRRNPARNTNRNVVSFLISVLENE